MIKSGVTVTIDQATLGKILMEYLIETKVLNEERPDIEMSIYGAGADRGILVRFMLPLEEGGVGGN